MKRTTLWAAWAALYSICTGLGFIPEPEGLLRALLFLLALGFFVPPALLLKRGALQDVRWICRLSLLSLGLTLGALIGSILSAFGSETLGDAMHVVLGLVSAPMFCSNYWVVSLFLWAVLWMVARKRRKES